MLRPHSEVLFYTMFTSNQEKQLFFTAGSASFGVCEENFFPCHRTGAWQTKAHCPAYTAKVMASQELPLPPNYKLLWHLSQSISRAFKKHKEAKWNRNVKKGKKGTTALETVEKCCLSLHLS